MPDAPLEQSPDPQWEHYSLWVSVIEAIRRVPQHFASTLSVSGVHVTELYSFSTVLGLMIEHEVVRTLNTLQPEWNIDGRYNSYHFVRQPQSFPDVLLRDSASRRNIIMGIELKSWYLLAKEREPSFRFTVTPAACALPDMLVIIPWVLSNVISGQPLVFEPFIISARYMADYRNYWWQNIRHTEQNTDIIQPSHVSTYPSIRDEISDKPIRDGGKNFGRLARVGLLDNYIKTFDGVDLLGFDVATWRQFFKEKGAGRLFDADEET